MKTNKERGRRWKKRKSEAAAAREREGRERKMPLRVERSVSPTVYGYMLKRKRPKKERRSQNGSSNSCRLSLIADRPLLKTDLVLSEFLSIRKNAASPRNLIHGEAVLYQRGTSPSHARANSAPPFDLLQSFLLFHLTTPPFQAPQQPPSESSQRQHKTVQCQSLWDYDLPCCIPNCFLWASSSSA